MGQEEKGGRQFVKFSFYRVAPQWGLLPAEERREGKEEVCAMVEEFLPRMMVRTYSLVGIRGDVDFLLWQASPRLEDFQELATGLLSTRLGPYLETPYSYLAMTRHSIYVEKHVHPGQEGRRVTVHPSGRKYLFVYPFVKTRAWYRLTKAARQGMMDEHLTIGHKYPSVKLNTTYSFGLDDQEFVLAFETDEPADFLDLVMELRESEASSYTLRDTPIFTCIAMGLPETLDSLGH